MQYVVFTVRFASLCILVAAAGTVAFLMYNGDIPQPDFRQILTQVAPSIGVGASGLAVLAVGLCFLLTAIAPLIYAARSGDPFTVVVSIVALVVCFTVLVGSRTVIDMVLAAIVYFTSALIAVIMYSTNRIADELRASAKPDRQPR
ncbi:hypothetical protein KMZ29_14735 [Bradyrhizobium sediminis]|uniref:Uncharacterized protein n=1 Tax=Bradyrhizobium sediminis TaxID=2840469 RepID=A0A975NA52_9BRAD|nr:hypothetical protein [Bradyrhizobium sediminis]QWG11035.1 hypothetical protein KMZ29_14735 [Bradyrhizobium sediminis]